MKELAISELASVTGGRGGSFAACKQFKNPDGSDTFMADGTNAFRFCRKNGVKKTGDAIEATS
jgi:bacteriocin-like protein